jgi:peptide/nickel transport system permease protein
MRVDYVVKRFGIFLLIVWIASSINFFLPRLRGQDPLRERLLEQAMLGGYVQAGIEEMVKEIQRQVRVG